MKLSSIRIIVCFVALLALVSTTFAKGSNIYLEMKDADGKTTKITLASDGSFTTQSIKKGSYTLSWVFNRGPRQTTSVDGTYDPKSSSREASTPSVSEITVSYDIVSPRDHASGLPTGKRMHKPLIIKMQKDEMSSDRVLPTVNKKLGVIDVDEDCDGITGKLVIKSSDGKTEALDDWMQQK